MSIVDTPPNTHTTTRTYATRGGHALAPAPQRRAEPSQRPSEPARHLRVVTSAERARQRLTPKVGVVLTALVFVSLFAVAIAHTLLVQGQIRLDGLDQQLTTEQARYRELRNQVAQMESPARVVAAAQQLGMVAPDDLVYLQPDAGEHDSTDGASGTSRHSSDWSAMKPLLDAPAQ